MKRTSQKRNLLLSTEKIRRLDASELRGVIGGTNAQTNPGAHTCGATGGEQCINGSCATTRPK